MFEFYKIKNPNEDRYSAGLRHGYIHDSKKGKTWSSLGHIKSHLTQVQRWDKRAFEGVTRYDDWIVLKITPNGVEEIGTVKDFRG